MDDIYIIIKSQNNMKQWNNILNHLQKQTWTNHLNMSKHEPHTWISLFTTTKTITHTSY
jgi:hypothetical protein